MCGNLILPRSIKCHAKRNNITGCSTLVAYEFKKCMKFRNVKQTFIIFSYIFGNFFMKEKGYQIKKKINLNNLDSIQENTKPELTMQK